MQRYLCSLKQIDAFVTGRRLSEINRRVIGDLQQRLGHSTIKTTEEYLKYVTADQVRVATHAARPKLKVVA